MGLKLAKHIVRRNPRMNDNFLCRYAIQFTQKQNSDDIKSTLKHYLKAELKDKGLEKLKSLLGSIFTELINADATPLPDNGSDTPSSTAPSCSNIISTEPMNNLALSEEDLNLYQVFLLTNERSDNTISKYISDVTDFITFLSGNPLTKDQCLNYNKYLLEKKYAVSTINSKLCALHSFLTFLDRPDCFVQLEKFQKKELKATYAILTSEDFHKLLDESSRPKKKKVNLIIRTFGQTGIRVSELQFVTVESIQQEEITIRNKNKNRKVPLIRELQELLNAYATEKNIQSGPIFTDKNKNPLERQNIYNMLQTIAANAEIDKRKAHPHALRHFLAKSFYEKTHDLVMLSNILGHSDISTTRNYVTGTFEELCNEMEEIGML